MSTLKSLLRRFWDVYPKQPLVYICSHNGVTGAVRAEDFDNEVRRMRKEFRHRGGYPPFRTAVRPQVYPVFLFSDKNPNERSFRVGTLGELEELLNDCAVEQRAFELPPLNAPGLTPLGYYSTFEAVGYEQTRHRVYTIEEADIYLHGGELRLRSW